MPPSLSTDVLGCDAADRLMSSRTITPAGCWEWSGARNGHGYGIIRIGGRAGWTERCHRVSYALFIGPVAPGVKVLHRCDNPPCFNPEHLFGGTPQDNTNDMLSKGRWRKPRPVRGERNAKAKLTEVAVGAAIDRLLRGDTRTAIAKDYGVTIGAISRIAVGKNWKHLTAGRGIVKSTRGVRRLHV